MFPEPRREPFGLFDRKVLGGIIQPLRPEVRLELPHRPPVVTQGPGGPLLCVLEMEQALPDRLGECHRRRLLMRNEDARPAGLSLRGHGLVQFHTRHAPHSLTLACSILSTSGTTHRAILTRGSLKV